jgi:hypothetical protein
MNNMPFKNHEAPILFLHSYALLSTEGIPFEAEHLDWFRPSEITELQLNMRSDFKTQINELFRRVSVGSVTFDDALRYLHPRELSLFREATDAERNQMPLAQMHPKDQIKGFWAVITKRTNSRSLSSLCRAVDLFNHVASGILSGTKGEAWAVLKTVEEFAPAVISAAEELVYRPEAKGEPGQILHEDGTRIQNLRVDLECLRPVMKRPGWSFSTDHLDRFLSLGDLIRDYLVLKNQPAILRSAESSE